MKTFHKAGKFGKKDFKKSGSFGDRPGRFAQPFEGGVSSQAIETRPGLFKTTCTQCGQEAIVPFKPTGKRPVLCKACLGKKDSFGSPAGFGSERPERGERPTPRFEGSASASTAESLESIHRKLDKIMRALKID